MKNHLFVIAFIFSFSIASAQSDCACCTDFHKQFDFWVGEWEASAAGSPAGHNLIVISQDSCVIQENWTSATSGYTGTSYNFYNRITKERFARQ